MELSLPQAARLLGKSERQLRYMLQSGRIPGRKENGRWTVARADLPFSAGQERAQQVKNERARDIVASSLDADDTPKSERSFTLRSLRVTQEGIAIVRDLEAGLGREHAAVPLQREAMMLLAAGFHAFHDRDKAESFVAARERSSRAVMMLLLDGDNGAVFADRIEQGWIPSLNGLIRRAERARR